MPAINVPMCGKRNKIENIIVCGGEGGVSPKYEAVENDENASSFPINFNAWMI